jgi:hypothetical protein
MTMKIKLLAAALGFALATAASAAVIPAPLGEDGAVIKVAEHCGPGWWRGPGGHCHPFAKDRVCPPHYHLGPDGLRCWPD